MIRRHRCIGSSFRNAHLIAGRVGHIGVVLIAKADTTDVADVMT
jgi:hypothetical protein